MSTEPKVSIIIRTLNEGYYLPGLIGGLKTQSYANWEIIHVDSGSTDETLNILSPYSAQTICITPQEFTFGYSLNLGCEAASGEYLVIVSAHVKPVNNTWLENLLSPFQENNIGMVYGKQIGNDDTRIGESRDLTKTFGAKSMISIDEPFSHNGNSALPKHLWASQPFDETLTGLEDLDWSKKIQYRGYRVYYAANANVYHLHDESLKTIYRRYLGEATAYSKIFPDSTFKKRDLVRAIFTESCRDFLYATKNKSSAKSIIAIPFERSAHFAGLYQGMNQKNKTASILSDLNKTINKTAEKVSIQGPNIHSLCSMEQPVLADNEILIHTGYSRIRQKDIARMEGTHKYNNSIMYPFTSGSEFSGLITQKGHLVNQFNVGDKVIGLSRDLASDITSLNNHDSIKDSSELWGSHATFVTTTESMIRRIQTAIPLLNGIFIESVSLGLNLVSKIYLDTHTQVCVVGAGYMGNLITQMIVAKGAHVTVIDESEHKLSLASKYGADTLRNCDNYGKFQYVIDTCCPEHTTQHIYCERNILLCENNCSIEKRPSSPTSNFSLIRNYTDEDFQKSLTKILNREIDLRDHGSAIYSLDNYKEAYSEYSKNIHLNIIIEPNKQLSTL